MLKLNVMVNNSHLEELKAVMSEYGINNNNSCICTDVYNTADNNTVFITVYFDDMVYWNWGKVMERIENVSTARIWTMDENLPEYDTVWSFGCSLWYNMVKAGCEFGVKNCIAVKNNNPFKPLY